MLLTEPDDLPDIFQDGNTPGVKELFNAYEEELLPIDKQLKRYKKRDLYSSHFYRTSYKVFGPRKNIRRLHYVEGNPFSNAESKLSLEENTSNPPNSILLPPYYAPKFPVSKPVKKTVEETTERAEENYQSWLNERRKLREGLDSFGLNISWLERKPERTCLEDRVLMQLRKHETQSKEGKAVSSQIETSTYPIPPSVMETLKMVAQCLLENKLLRSIIFKNGETKHISVQHCKDGLSMLQQNGIISSESVDEVVNHFYRHNKSSELFYLKLTQLMKDFDPSFSTLKFMSAVKEITEASTDIEPPSKTRTIAEAMALRRNLRMAEFEETLKLCEERSVPLGGSLLKKVLLHPGDLESNVERATMIRQPGEMLSENFWKVDQKKRTRRKKLKETEQNDKQLQEKTSCDTDSDEGSARSQGSKLSISDSASNSRGSLESTKDVNEAVGVFGVIDAQPVGLENLNIILKLPDLESEESIKHHKRRKDTNSVGSEDTDDAPDKKHSQTIIRFPSLRDTLPERHQVNLSTGRAFVGRKVDCWMSSEEFEKITNTPMDTPLRRHKSNYNAFWPGHDLDKMRLWRSSCDSHRPPKCDDSKSKRSVFHLVKTLPHNGRRSNYGYDNNMLTWPTDGRYVKYGDIDQDKVYHI